MTEDIDLDGALALVRGLVADRGRLVMSRWPTAAPAVYKDRRDIATAVDLEVEKSLRDELRARFPGHGLSGEETAPENPGSDYQWLIDPIDGTKYYAGQASLFAISVGLVRRGEPILGVVHSPPSGQCFYARAGGGAFVDGRRLTGPAVAAVTEAIANVDTPATDRLPPEEREWFEAKLLELTRRVYRVRALGIASMAACWLASGALDAYVDLTGYAQPQDLAAGRVIMAEAGARAELIEPPVGPRRLLAAPPRLWEQLREILLARDG